MPTEQTYRSIPGAQLDRTIKFIRPTRDPVNAVEEGISELEEGEGEPSWSHHQVAIPKHKLPLEEHGFEKTRLAIPLPGESWFTPSWRRGQLHAHEAGPVYLVHKDADKPGLMHMLRDVPGALWKRLMGSVEPFVKEKNVKTAMLQGFQNELEKIAEEKLSLEEHARLAREKQLHVQSMPEGAKLASTAWQRALKSGAIKVKDLEEHLLGAGYGPGSKGPLKRGVPREGPWTRGHYNGEFAGEFSDAAMKGLRSKVPERHAKGVELTRVGMQQHASDPLAVGSFRGRAQSFKSSQDLPYDMRPDRPLLLPRPNLPKETTKYAYGAEPNPHGGFLLASYGNAQIPLRTKTPGPPKGVPMAGTEKDSDYGFTWGPGDFRQVDINKKHAAALSPAGMLASKAQIGKAAGSFARKGPSVAEVSKPHGFGRALPGAVKGI